MWLRLHFPSTFTFFLLASVWWVCVVFISLWALSATSILAAATFGRRPKNLFEYVNVDIVTGGWRGDAAAYYELKCTCSTRTCIHTYMYNSNDKWRTKNLWTNFFPTSSLFRPNTYLQQQQSGVTFSLDWMAFMLL